MSKPVFFRTHGHSGVYRAIDCVLSDAEVDELVKPVMDFWTRGHGADNVPAVELLRSAFRLAWGHHNGPRRKKLSPALHARDWALADVNRLCMCWVTKRPDMTGAWLQHKELADWPNRKPASVAVDIDVGTGSVSIDIDVKPKAEKPKAEKPKKEPTVAVSVGVCVSAETVTVSAKSNAPLSKLAKAVRRGITASKKGD